MKRFGGVKVSIQSLALVVLLFSSANFAGAQSAIQSGNKLYSQQKYELAIKEYERLAANDTEYATAIYNIGVCNFELWRTEEAIASYKQAINLRQGNYPKATFALAIALEEENRIVEAKEEYLRTIRSAADEYPWAKIKLGLLEANDGHFEIAARLFKEAGAHPGEHLPSSHNNLGVMLARMGRLTEAEREFGIALRKAGGRFAAAAHNLELCRSLRAGTQVREEDSLALSTSTFFR